MGKSALGTLTGSYEYELLEKIAEGGFGITYKAKHKESGKLVCIKQCINVSKEDDEFLREEAGNMWDLSHGAIPIMRDIIRFDKKLALVMSYIPGRTVEQLVEEFFPKTGRGFDDPEDVVWITERVLNALWYLHDHEVMHGDIKPQNIIVQKEHTAVLVDFGLAMVKPKPTEDSKGYTEYFSAPEQVAGGEPISPASDLYSLGMTMLYALGGMKSVKTKEVPKDTPKPLRQFIERMILRDKTNRPQNAGKLFKELKDLRIEVFKREHSDMKPIPGLT